MTKQRTPGKTESAADEAALTRTYRTAAKETPPSALDARILAEARNAITPTRRSFGARWTIPLSVAAVAVLSVGVVLRLAQEGALDQTQITARMEQKAPEPVAPAAPVKKYEGDGHKLTRARSAEPTALADAEGESARAPATPEAPSLSVQRDVPVSEPAAAKPKDDYAPMTTPAESEAAKAESAARADATRLAKRERLAAVATRPTADVASVQVNGKPGAYEFSVRVSSPDRGCEQYADWWEVISEDGKLIYRRVLLHSHVDEQPFERSGDPMNIQRETVVWIRAHMNNAGYGGVAWKGSVKHGFVETPLAPTFATGLATQPPLPQGCAY